MSRDHAPLTIEPDGESRQDACPDCGASTRSVWGYVYENEDARAVYVIRWTEGHRERGTEVLVSIGAWGEGTVPAARRAFGLECRLLDNGQAFMIDARGLPWSDEHLGTPLSRADALGDELKPRVFAILDRLVEDDPRFHDLLAAAKS